MEVNFYLKTESITKDGLTPVYVNIAFGERLRMYTGEKINAKNWITKNKKNRVSSKEEGYLSINDYFQWIEDTVSTKYRDAKKEGVVVTKELVRAWINRKNKKEDINGARAIRRGKSVHEAYAAWQEKEKNRLSSGYLTLFNQCIRHVTAFKPDVVIEDFTPEFFLKYIDYLVEKTEISNTTLATHTLYFRKMLQEEGRDASWAKTSLIFSPDRVFLDWDELFAIAYQPLPSRALEDSRDVFLFCCFTGLRYSDVEQLHPSDVFDQNGIKVMRLRQIKKAGAVSIAINDYAVDILNKHKGRYINCLPVVGDTRYNMNIKKIARLSGINRPIKTIKYKGNNRIEVIKPKYELLSSHTARHTFATLSLMKGMDITVLSKIMGHKGIETTMIYAKIIDEEKHKQMLDVWKR